MLETGGAIRKDQVPTSMIKIQAVKPSQTTYLIAHVQKQLMIHVASSFKSFVIGIESYTC